MVHYIALYKLQEHVDDEKIEEMIRGCRSHLFRIHEVHNVRSGKRIEPEMEYPFFVAIDFENLDKLKMYREDPLQVKFDQEVIKPNTSECVELFYETEPGKNVKYS